jgi:hypothetical protein
VGPEARFVIAFGHLDAVAPPPRLQGSVVICGVEGANPHFRLHIPDKEYTYHRMNLGTLKDNLRRNAAKNVRFILPDGDPIPAEFHVTEVGHVVRNFIDCGGTVRRQETCLLQTWVAGNDAGHRLSAEKFAKILELSAKVIPSEDLDVEVEYEPCCVAQYRIDRMESAGGELRFQLAHKHTDCLAREACGLTPAGSGCGCGDANGGCC